MDGGSHFIILAGGLLAGLLGALMGLGGGIVAIPFVNLVAGVPMRVASASGLVSTLATSCGASGRHLCAGERIEIEAALDTLLATALGALGGGLCAGWLRGPALQLLFSGMLVFGGVQIGRSALRKGAEEQVLRASRARRPVLDWVLFCLAGVVSGLLGVGGGLMVVPLLHLVIGMPFKTAAATSNFMMGVTAIPALCAFIARGELDLGVAIPVAAGVLVGANLGAWLQSRIATPWLKGAFVLLLAFTAFQMAWQGIGAW